MQQFPNKFQQLRSSAQRLLQRAQFHRIFGRSCILFQIFNTRFATQEFPSIKSSEKLTPSNTNDIRIATPENLTSKLYTQFANDQ